MLSKQLHALCQVTELQRSKQRPNKSLHLTAYSAAVSLASSLHSGASGGR